MARPKGAGQLDHQNLTPTEREYLTHRVQQLTDEAAERLRRGPGEIADEAAHASHLLVIRKGEVNRTREVLRGHPLGEADTDSEIASEIYSTAGSYDILTKFHVDYDVDIGRFIAEHVQTIPEIADTNTIITLNAF